MCLQPLAARTGHQHLEAVHALAEFLLQLIRVVLQFAVQMEARGAQAQHLAFLVVQHALRAFVEQRDASVQVGGDDGHLDGGIQQGLQPGERLRLRGL